jgi:hypothetical protein
MAEMTVQQEWEDAMTTADVVVRNFERNVEKLRLTISKIARAVAEERGRDLIALSSHASAQIAGLLVNIQTPELDKWRKDHAARENARHEQQEILARKLSRAKALLILAGWDSEKLESELKAAVPQGRDFARRSFRNRAVRKREGVRSDG